MADKSKGLSRKDFISQSSRLATAGFLGALPGIQAIIGSAEKVESTMKFGLVTYLWGKDWKLPALIRNCETAGVHGVELRVDHAHGVSPAMNARQRHEVRLRFEQAPVELVGFGTNYAFHYTDPEKVRANLHGAKQYVQLSREVGGSGVKVKPNGLPDGVSEQKTIEQIGTSLNELGEYAAGMGQQIRVEVHGNGTQRLPIIHRIFEVVDQPNVGVCWNCNDEDLAGKGLKYNFNLVKDDLGRTLHTRALNTGRDYPYQQLLDLFAGVQYDGWILLEARTNPDNRIKALHRQNELYKKMIAKAE